MVSCQIERPFNRQPHDNTPNIMVVYSKTLKVSGTPKIKIDNETVKPQQT